MLLIIFALERTKIDICSTGFRESTSALDNKTDMVEVEYEVEGVPQPAVIALPIVEKPPAKEEAPIAVATEEKFVSISPTQAQEISNPETKKIKVKVKKLIKVDYVENHWKRLFWLPLAIDNKAHTLALTRRGFRYTAPGAKSNIDCNVGFASIKDILVYLPRAAQIAFLAPFPDQWLREGSYQANSLMRRISAIEMIVIYFALIFLPYAIWYWRRRIEIWVISVFCVCMMFIYGLVVCNIGTLYRMRYLYITILVALGIAGFMAFLEDLKIKKKIK
jgi:hypothetical protein